MGMDADMECLARGLEHGWAKELPLSKPCWYCSPLQRGNCFRTGLGALRPQVTLQLVTLPKRIIASAAAKFSKGTIWRKTILAKALGSRGFPGPSSELGLPFTIWKLPASVTTSTHRETNEVKTRIED